MRMRMLATLAVAAGVLLWLGGGAAWASGSATAPSEPRLQSVRQLIVVSAPSYRDTHATLRAYDVTRAGRRMVLGPWPVRVGYSGIAPPGQKREGDGRTPSGTYGFQFAFGIDRNPGVRLRYRRARSYDVWDDDPSSPLYNRWVDTRTHDPGSSPEPMDQAPAYDYGAVLAYNTAHTPGLGSAIFLHVAVGAATAGCVALPRGELLEVLRWLAPVRSPQIRIGVEAAGAH